MLHIKPIIYRELFLSLGSQAGEKTSLKDTGGGEKSSVTLLT